MWLLCLLNLALYVIAGTLLPPLLAYLYPCLSVLSDYVCMDEFFFSNWFVISHLLSISLSSLLTHRALSFKQCHSGIVYNIKKSIIKKGFYFSFFLLIVLNQRMSERGFFFWGGNTNCLLFMNKQKKHFHKTPWFLTQLD